MKLVDIIPNPEVLYALEPDELGLRMLPALADWNAQHRMVELTLENFIRTVTGDDRGLPSSYPINRRSSVEEAVREAWAWLEGAALLIKHRGYHEPNYVRSLSRRAHQLADQPDPRRAFTARRIPKDSLHPSIREDVWALYHRGKFDTAVFEAMKAVEVAVRDAAGLSADLVGVALMRRAFRKDDGPLTDGQAEEGERDARAHLFAGAIGSYKNPQSHRKVALDDPDEAAEIIMLANHLLRIVDSREAGKA